MSKTDYIQTSFAGGEFGSSLFGRTDVAQYANACAIVENFLVRPYGSAISTPGTRFVAEVKDSTKRTRLIPFVFNRTDAYVIEFSPGYFRFYTDGGVVVSSGTTPYELANPYTASEIFDVQFAQLNDVIWLTHPDHAPQQLTRLSSNSWTLSTLAFLGGPFLDDNDTAITMSSTDTAGTISVYLSATTSSISFVPSTSATILNHVNSYWKMGLTRTDSTTGIEEQGYFKVTKVVSSVAVTATVIKTLTTSVATTSWAEGAWSDVNGWPSCVSFHESRLFFANTDQEPQKVWGSKSFIFDDFALDGAADDDAINIQLASNEANEIQWLTAGASLIAGTYGGEFTITGGVDTPMTPTNINAQKQNSWGSEKIIPKKIGNYYYYIQRFGKKLRELFYFWDLDSYKSVDKTILSPQILGDGVVDMAYQQNPDTILYCVLTNGTIATLTREVDQEMQAWSRQKTDGLYESITTIPSQSDPYDQIWCVVKRTITDTVGTTVTKRYVEYFENIDLPDRQDLCFYLHSGLTYNAYTAKTSTNISLSATSGTITITSSTAAFNIADDVGERIRAIDVDGVTVGECLITSVSSTSIVHATTTKDFDAKNYTNNYWGLSVDEISGIDHLEGKTVKVLADGGLDKPDKVVSLGTIALAYNYFVVSVGLPYTQKIKTLPVEAGSQRGTSQGKIQKINQVGFKVNRSYKGFKTGGDEDLAEKINFRDPATLMGTPELLYTGIIPNIDFNDDYRYGAQVMIVNEEPLPVEILSIMSSVDTNDK
jgi:hypothetical protein